MIRLGRGRFNGDGCALDAFFTDNINGALGAGLDVGVYFYSYAQGADDARAEAQFVLDTLASYAGRLTYPVAFDLEDSSQQYLGKNTLTDMIVAFAGVLQAAGYYAILYSNTSWLAMYDAARLKDLDVWLAQWAVKPSYTGSFGIWQHSNTGSVPGIAGNVDLDIAYRDYPAIIRAAGMNGFPKGSAEPAPATTTTPATVGFTAAGLVEYVRRVLTMNTVYMWGGIGELLTNDFITRTAAQYPNNYTAARIAKLKSLVGKGYYGIDCVGLIKSYYWGGVGNLKYIAAQDLSANGMYAAATVKGDISTMPETPGLCVWMSGHIGVYVGDGNIIESTSNATFGDGVCKTRVSDRYWSKWLQCPYISYETPVPVPATIPDDDWRAKGLKALVDAGVVGAGNVDYWKGRFGEAVTFGELMGILGKMIM